ncbi:TetR/AcrR family transcriptional regulator [Acidisoma silvae]|uniref:TetR/AcrR family transcriptional regulator n=1 Tax=Acidisoma silvae TaxID=2802396 RepID=UPI001D09D3C2|nr:TetR/AcrR family transcriptional regulator [Acidisoma silvae]
MTPPAPIRKPRADSLRNREKLLSVAKTAFAEQGPDVSLEEIARRAEVGIGTLYRHFPNRDAIIADVYRREVGQLAEAAADLLERQPPLEALRAWMRLFVDYIATKKLIAPALNALPGGTDELYAASGPLIINAVTLLVERARATTDIREDVEPLDLVNALLGLAYGFNLPDWQASATRLVDVLVDGLQRTNPPAKE